MSAAPPPLVIVLTGPSGVGKDSVFDRMVERGVPVARPATMTTRGPRPGEEEGVHHYFVTPDEFREHVAAGELLEHAEVYGNFYGVPRKAVRAALDSGRDVVVRVDIQGAEALHALLPEALFVCLTADGMDDLKRRLTRRSTEPPEAIEQRLSIARAEIEQASRFCFMVVNREGRLDETVDEVLRLMEAARSGPDADRHWREMERALEVGNRRPVGPSQSVGPSATSEQETQRLADSAKAGRPTALVRDASLIEAAILAIQEARNSLLEIEGRGIEKALVEELVLPELDWLESALNLETSVIQELLQARSRIWRAQDLLSRAARAFERAGEIAIAGVVGNAAYQILLAVPMPTVPWR